MFLGAFLFWLFRIILKENGGHCYRIFVENQETTCAGAIAGGALVGILLVVLSVTAFCVRSEQVMSDNGPASALSNPSFSLENRSPGKPRETYT